MTRSPAFKAPLNDSFRDFDAILGAAAGAAQAAPEALDVESAMALKFEALYAELTPPAAAPPGEPEYADGLSFELPPDVPNPPPVMKARAAQRPPAVEPYLERPTVVRAEPGGGKARKGPQAEDTSLSEALAVLRAAETRGRAAKAHPARETVDDNDDGPVSGQIQAGEITPKPFPLPTEPSAVPAGAVAANESWSARSGNVWPKLLGAAALALVVGAGLGYVYGTSPGVGASKAKIQVTPEGGTQLRIERELLGR